MENNFINKARHVHNNEYAYNLVDYKKSSLKVKIICATHGIFEQAPYHHLEGSGCPKCSRLKNKPPIKLPNPTKNKIGAIKIHGNRYDYLKTNFNLVVNKVIITCKIHGDFYQVLAKHLSGRGCPDCGGSRKKTQKEFIVESNGVHGELYDYSLSIYNNFEEKLVIICKRHGEFHQTPHNHIIGKQGCPHCTHRISKGETAWLDYIGLPNDKFHRNVLIYLNDRKIKADGYDSNTATVYEFYGDYYHGNPRFHKSDTINPHTKCAFGELYKRTLEKEKSILESGLKLISIWEYEWKALNDK